MKKIIAVILLIVYCLFFIWILRYITDRPLTLLLAVLLSIPFMTITHELGHLVFGLMTGYRLFSFRIFSLELYRESEKWKFRKKKTVSSVGQCLMAPPEKIGSDYPYRLYHLGGIFLCAFLSLIPIVISLFFIHHPLFGMPLFFFGFMSFAMNLLNAIPTSGKAMSNDATNVRMAKTSEAGKIALWNQLTYLHLHFQKIRPADMPRDIFFQPKTEDLGNILVQWQILANVEYLEDCGEYEKAWETVNFILKNAPFLPTSYRNRFQIEFVYLGTLLDIDDFRIDDYYLTLVKRDNLKNIPSYQRMCFSYLLLRKKDSSAADAAYKIYTDNLKKSSSDDVRTEYGQLEKLESLM